MGITELPQLSIKKVYTFTNLPSTTHYCQRTKSQRFLDYWNYKEKSIKIIIFKKQINAQLIKPRVIAIATVSRLTLLSQSLEGPFPFLVKVK